MNLADEIFLARADKEKVNLFNYIKTYVLKEMISYDRLPNTEQAVLDYKSVNLRNVAITMNKSYGSLYNTYLQIINDFKSIMHQEDPDVNEVFSQDEDTYRYFLIRNSLSYQFLLNFLQQEENLSVDEFIFDHETSKATLMRHLKPLRDYLRGFDIRIGYDQLDFLGDEQLIRLALAFLFWNVTNDSVWPFSRVSEEKPRQLRKLLAQHFDFQLLNAPSRALINYYLAVTLIRIDAGHYLTELEPKYDLLNYPFTNIVYNFYCEQSEPILEQISTAHCLYETECIFLTLNILPFRFEGQQVFLTRLDLFERHNRSLYQFVDAFLKLLPIDFERDYLIDKIHQNALRLNLLQVSLGTIALGATYLRVFEVFRGNSGLYEGDWETPLMQSIRNTVEHLTLTYQVVTEHVVDELTTAYFFVIRRLLKDKGNPVRVKITVLIPNNTAIFSDVYDLLANIQHVKIASVDQITADSDLVISTADASQFTAELPENVYFQKVTSPLKASDLGTLVTMIYIIWQQKQDKLLENSASSLPGLKN